MNGFKTVLGLAVGTSAVALFDGHDGHGPGRDGNGRPGMVMNDGDDPRGEMRGDMRGEMRDDMDGRQRMAGQHGGQHGGHHGDAGHAGQKDG